MILQMVLLRAISIKKENKNIPLKQNDLLFTKYIVLSTFVEKQKRILWEEEENIFIERIVYFTKKK